jgi:putative ABC transport system permease protein
MKLVVIAILIATPVAWWVMQKQFLQSFAYRTTIHWYLLALAGVSALIIAFATIGYQFIKAAVSNPVNSLRSE